MADPADPAGGPVSWEDRIVTVGRRDVHLRIAGPPMSPRTTPADGRPVVVLRDAGADSVDAPAWSLVAAQHRVVQVLLPGVGDSAPISTDSPMSVVTDLLDAILTALDLGPAVVVGTSLGGWFALELALAAPTAVAHLVMLDAAGLHQPPGYLLGLFADGQGTAGHDGLLGPLMARHGLAERSAQTLPPYLVEVTSAALASWSPHTPSPTMLRRAARVAVPTTIAWGTRDALIPLAHGQAYAAAIPGARWHPVAGGGHLLAVEAPEAVADLIDDVLSAAPDGRGADGPGTT